jgi:tyrosine-protein kinase Etk/Wzc
MKKIIKTQSNSPALIEEVTYKYLPYWPLLLLLLIPSLMTAWVYLKYKTPVYEIAASMQVKDEKKGVDEDQITGSLNMISPKSIVENEVEIIHSRKFIDEVVKDLKLYAPTSIEQGVKKPSAYEVSPIVVEAQDPDNLKEVKKVYYAYDFNKKFVQIDNKNYPLNQFAGTKYGFLKFSANPHFKKSEQGKLFFALVEPRKVTEDLFARIDVSSVGKLSSIVKLKMKDAIPQRGEDVLNKLIEKYNTSTIAHKTELAKNTMAFLDQRIAQVVNDLSGVERKVQNFRSSQGVVNLTDQSRLYLQNVAMNDQKLGDINMQLSVLDQVENYVTSKQSSGIVPSTLGMNDPLLSKLLERLYDAESQRDKLKQTTAENNPAVQAVANQIQTLKPAILDNIRSQRTNLEASRNNLNITNNSYNSMLGTIPVKERQLIDVSRNQATKANLYNFLLQKREQTALAYSSSIAESQVIDAAQATVKPVSPNKMFTYLMAFGFALVCAVAYIIYRDILSNRILFRSDILKATTQPVVGEISYVRKGKQRLLTGVDYSNSQDEFRQLAIAGGFFAKENKNKKILVTSSIDGEGKTLIAANLALTIAQAGKSVVLLDMDLRKPQLSKTFKQTKALGLAEYLSGEVTTAFEVLKPSGYKNLSIISAGELTSNPAELFLTGRWESLLNELEQRFDLVIIDAPPVNPAADAYILSDFADTTLYVVRHRYTPKSFLRKLDETNELKPLKGLSLVFNGVKPRGFIIRTKAYGYGHKQIGYNNKLLKKLRLRGDEVYQPSYPTIKEAS